MTSTAPQQTPPAPNTSAASSAASYASAAGANKKPSTSTPLIATGSNQPPVVVGSSGPSAQNAKPSSSSPVNGRPSITPAVPTVSAVPSVAHGSSTNINGGGAAHDRKSSVTISASGPSSLMANGGPVGGPKSGMPQFGYQESSPAVAHSTPLPGAAAPRVPSPQQSPSPIPIPSASGGRPPSGLGQPGGPPQMTFGSFGGEGDRHLRQPSNNQNPVVGSPANTHQHMRQESTQSIQSDIGNHNHNPSRGGYAQGGRGRGGYNTHNAHNGHLGYPPNNYQRTPSGQGRGNIGPSFPNQHTRQYPNSPQPMRASPAQTPVMPHGTPNMSAAIPMQNPAQYNHAYYPTAGPGNPMHQVLQPPSSSPDLSHFKNNHKRRNGSQQSDKSSRSLRTLDASQQNGSHAYSRKPRRSSKRWDQWSTAAESDLQSSGPSQEQYGFPPVPEDSVQQPTYSVNQTLCYPSVPAHHIDLSPESGNFEKMLMANQQNIQPGYYPPQPYTPQGYAYPQAHFDNMNRQGSLPNPFYAHSGPMGHAQSPAPSYAGPYPSVPPQQFGQPVAAVAHPMSRNSSQVSERPQSSTSQNQGPLVAQGTPQPHQVQPKPAASSPFVRPKKTSAIRITNQAGEAVDLKVLKTPASPAPSMQSKTPPVVQSTPTPPPPKADTPSHARTGSTSASRTAEQVRKEFQEQVRKTAEAPPDADTQTEEVSKAVEETKPQAEAEDKAAEATTASQEKVAEEPKPMATEEPEATGETQAKDQTDAGAKQAPAKEPEKAPAEEEDEVERMIREMEEADAKREAEQEAITAKKMKEAAEAKKLADQARKTSAADNDRKLREQEAEMERLEEERERKSKEGKGVSVADALAAKISDLTLSNKKGGGSANAETATDKAANAKLDDRQVPSPTAAESSASLSKAGASEKQRANKPAALNLTPLTTKPVEPPQPSAALQSLKSARFLQVMDQTVYPAGIASPNPALNSAVAKKGKTFKYDAQFLLQFQKVFTEQPSMEFHQQVKSLIGDHEAGARSASARTPAGSGSGRQGSRAGSSGFPMMGAFTQAKALPPGTTSEQRFAMSQSGSRPMNPMPFNRPGGSFPGGASLSRTPSSTTMGIPNSPRQGSRNTRGGSKRGDFKAEAQAAKTMPLTAGMEVKPIVTSSSGWKPTSLTSKGASSAPTQSGHMDPEMVQRKVKAALNKMTPEKFDRIADQILEIAGQSKNEQDGRTLRQVIQLTFEKATDESHWASMYAKFCKRMLETMSPEIRDVTITDKNGNVVNGGALFRKYLLNRCQEDFERGWKVDLPKPKEGEDNNKTLEAAMLSDEYYIAAAAKRRGLGLVQFIGELYKLGMLTERIMHECVRKLVDYQGVPDEAEIESLSKLLRTIGGNLDSTEKGKLMMDAYFERIQKVVDMPELPSRLKFMLMDIIDLRRVGWVSKEGNKGPKTLEEVRAEAEAQAAQKAAEAARSSQRGPAGGRPAAGRGDARHFSGYNQSAPNQVGMDDLRRLKGSTNRTSSANVTLGPTSMFSSRSNSGRRLGPGSSLGRAGEESGASSRTGTPPTREAATHSNAFSLLATMDSEHPASPPSTSASPSLSKVVPESSANGDKKKGGE